MTKLCAECGKRTVEPVAAPGRRVAFKNFPALAVPADLAIPTCTACGTEWIDRKAAERIDAALADAAAATLAGLAREAIEALGVTINQRDLEIRLGVSPGYISKVKHGRETPSAQLVSCLALLAVSPRRLQELDHIWATGHLPPRVTVMQMTRVEGAVDPNLAVAS